MFKGYVIEYGSYLLAGILAHIIQEWAGVSFWQFWGIIVLGMVWAGIIPIIHLLAWGKDV